MGGFFVIHGGVESIFERGTAAINANMVMGWASFLCGRAGHFNLDCISNAHEDNLKYGSRLGV